MKKIIISASRRTDIPAFYMAWFIDSIEKGGFTVTNPYNRRAARIYADRENVHTIVFWSKNFGPFLEGDYGTFLSERGYGLFFNFTINSENKLLEPNIPPLSERIAQAERLVDRFGASSVLWRFDPVCHWFYDGRPQDNLKDFSHIATRLAEAGIRNCITSFMDIYAKVEKRTSQIPGFVFYDPPAKKKIAIITRMYNLLNRLGIALSVCCEKDLAPMLPESVRLSDTACIPAKRILENLHQPLLEKQDPGQRVKKGCKCNISSDIGDYRLHPCRHGCLYCYANPKWKIHENRRYPT